MEMEWKWRGRGKRDRETDYKCHGKCCERVVMETGSITAMLKTSASFDLIFRHV